MNNENMSSGKGLTLVKTTLLPGQERVTVVASLPTSPSCDVTANIPIVYEWGQFSICSTSNRGPRAKFREVNFR